MSSDCDNKIIDIIARSHYYFIFMIGGVSITYPLLILFENYIVIVLFWAPIICYIAIGTWVYGRNSKRIIQKDTSNCGESIHHAIIIAHKKSKGENSEYPIKDYSGGIDLLISTFCNHNPPISYKIYDIELKNDAKIIINNPLAEFLWIFGHGRRNKLSLADGTLCYYEVRNAPKKQFIGQYHCNSPLGKSLADYLNPPYRDVTRFFRFSVTIRYSVGKKLREMGIIPKGNKRFYLFNFFI